ncbi:uncharacterized protein LOC130510498 [Raphanus sativus]|uniref:Uncharacterized protein LOC108852325 n=1 Tax=Raphanus sativus TaxID=3726 RepID=A0A6J0NA05_RAPSA|nr:uncharacterized protein LOC108852325 [Raphanus sativus]XP_056862843.1 uncharacterized protein LOC130510498 [Raphanus sativus]
MDSEAENAAGDDATGAKDAWIQTLGCILIENQKLLQEISSQNFLLDKMEEMQKKNVTKAELKQLEKKMIKHIQKNIQLMVKELFDATGELKGMLHHEESSTLIIADVKRQIAELKNSLEDA